MEIAVHSLLLGMREALMIWSVLVAAVLVPLALFAYWSRAAHSPVRSAPVRSRRRPPVRESADDVCRYAEEVAVAAHRAAATAAYRRAEWLAAQRTRDAAWRAYESACAAARRVRQAAAYPLPDTPLTLADRTRYLHRAANQAYRRGELSGEQLIDALAHRDGWDPARHPFEQDLRLRRLGEQRLLRAYQLASTIEREAWQATEIAAAAKRCLDDEAFAATERARQARYRIAATATRRERRAAAVVWTPRLAAR